MKYRLPIFVLVLILIGDACRTARSVTSPIRAAATETGLLTCFPAGTSLDNKPIWCEASAVLFDGQQVFIANDKDMPTDLSSVFRKNPNSLSDTTQAPSYVAQAAFSTARKYEDFSQTPDGKFVFLTTAFDRVKPDSPEWDAYNTVMYWRKGNEQHPQVLMPAGRHTTSVGFRQKLARVLAPDQPAGAPYFKIEGMAVTDRQLLFGIREVGQAFDKFTYVNKIVAVSYTVGKKDNQDRIQLFDDWRVVADFNPASIQPSLPEPLGLSSIEYDPVHRCLWLLTSYEKDGKLDAYVWTNTLGEMAVGKPFKLVRERGGRPLRFGHKAEDLTLLDSKRMLVIHDDDRVQTTVGKQTRQPNQAAYTIVTLR